MYFPQALSLFIAGIKICARKLLNTSDYDIFIKVPDAKYT